MEKPVTGSKKVFMTGNETVAWAALAAEADIMFGYPITPQNEIMHYWTRLGPKYGRKFLQTEDEISAGFTVCGAIMAGKKAFTATAGPGNTLMQEPFSMAEGMGLPTVAVIQQRGGPSSGTVIYSQQEVTLTTYGGNGEGHRLVYSTASNQELYDYTIKAFNVAWKYKFPTFVLGDGYQAKMREALEIYEPAERGIEIIKPTPLVGIPGKIGIDREPQHLSNIYSLEEELYEAVMKIQERYDRICPEIVEYKLKSVEDAEILVVSHGVVSRSVDDAVEALRAQGIKVGSFRPITLRPFPTQALLDVLGLGVKKILLVESAYGQLFRLMRQEIYGATVPIETLFKPGVGIIDADIIKIIETMI